MGLDITHGCWTGAYSCFHRFRLALAAAAGYEILKRSMVAAAVGYELVDYEADASDWMVWIAWERYSDDNFAGIWAEPPADPLLQLIVHYDCDGHIAAEHTGPLANRLEALLPQLEADLREPPRALAHRGPRSLARAHAALYRRSPASCFRRRGGGVLLGVAGAAASLPSRPPEGYKR